MNTEHERFIGLPEAYDLADKFDAQREGIQATLEEIGNHQLAPGSAIAKAKKAIEDLRKAMETMRRTV